MPNATEIAPNRFKQGLTGGAVQYGLWLSLADPVAAEIAAGAGFDWLTIDQEHAPNDVRTTLAQLQAVAAYPVEPIIRPLRSERSLLKQAMDLGARTILAPMVDTAEHAAEMAAAVRYPPTGVRGVASARAARWGRATNHWERADAEACLIVQIESTAALDALDEIAAVDGVDALFVGPSDLGAALGHLGQADHPEVRAAVVEAIGAIRAAGKPAGVLATTPERVEEYVAAGATFVGVGVDTMVLARATSDLAGRWTGPEVGSDG
jgi:4-hydroxy-2-oxoheptanedioate aldolase